MGSREDTITAIATAAGTGAVGIVRCSGANAATIVSRCFAGLPERPESHRLYFGHVRHPLSGEVVDEALAVVMRGPRSFTGEDVAELQCHGGALNLRRVLDALLAGGARQAEPGEFSLRAFLNGRLDLAQAEAISDIIAAESQEALRVAQAQLSGALSRPIAALRERLLELLVLLEAALDFAAEEHVYQLPASEVHTRIDEVRSGLARLLAAWEHGRPSLGGVRVVILGAPNAGKSSLFNRLLGMERAIVTEIPGTTRDLLEESSAIGGHRVHLVDTAGLRATDDAVEREGVERAEATAATADIILWVIDGARSDALPSPPEAFVQASRVGRALAVISKVDLLDSGGPSSGSRSARYQRAELVEELSKRLSKAVPIGDLLTVSAHTGEGVAWCEQALSEVVARVQARSNEDVALVTSARHATALRRADEALERATAALSTQMPLEFVASDTREAADAMGEIVGAIATDDVLAGIFSRFCVGK